MWNPQLQQHLELFDNENDNENGKIKAQETSEDDRKLNEVSSEEKSDRKPRVYLASSSGWSVWILGVSLGYQTLFVEYRGDWHETLFRWGLFVLMLVAVLDFHLPRQQKQPTTPSPQMDRVRVSTLLGEMGAPPLNEPRTDTAVITESTPAHPIPSNAQQRLKEMIQQHRAFLHSVDDGLQVLQTSTRMQLGLQWKPSSCNYNNGGVDRVESATVGRHIRHNQRLLHHPYPLSLPTIRNRLYTLLDRQCRCLQRLLMIDASLEDDKNNDIGGCDDVPPEEPITLTLLRSKKIELLHLLSNVTSRFFDSTVGTHWDTLERATQLAQESHAYLESCLFTQSSNLHDDGNVNRDVREPEQSLNSLVEQLLGMEIATRSLQDDLQQCRQSSNQVDCEFVDSTLEWWHKIQTMAQQLEALVERINQQFISANCGCSNPESMPLQPDTTAKARPEENGEYAQNDEELQKRTDAGATHYPFPGQDRHPKDKTLVFLVDHPQLDDTGKKRWKGGHNSQTMIKNPILLDPEEQLLQELENRLTSLPLAEEVTVTQQPNPHEEAACSSQNKQEVKSSQSKERTDKKSQVMMSFSPHAEPQQALQFQGELAASLAGFGIKQLKEDEEDDPGSQEVTSDG